MIIDVDPSREESVRLDDGDVFTALKIRAHGDPARAREVVAGFGVWADDEHAFVPEARLRELAGQRAHDAEWRSSFDGMVRFAARSGWVDSDGRVRVHAEFTD